MEAAPEDDAARLAFHAVLADTPLHLMLLAPPAQGRLRPRIFDLDEGPFVLVFDTEERLADFAAGPAETATLTGRQIARMLGGQGIGLALNLGAPSAMLLPAEAVDWLAEMLSQTPRQTELRLDGLRAPQTLPPALMARLDARLARAGALAREAWLVETGPRTAPRLLLAVIGAPEPAQDAIAQAVAEALGFSGLEGATLDVTFLTPEDPRLPLLAGSGLRIDLPAPAAPERPAPRAPGSDPDKPPRLR